MSERAGKGDDEGDDEGVCAEVGVRSASPEETFDPRDPAEWAAFRQLAHRMVDDMLGRLEGLPGEPAWRQMPAAVAASFDEPVPVVGVGAAAAYEEFVERVLPYPNGNLHPRFWGWVQGNGTPLGMMAEMLAAGLNPHMAGFNQAPARVEDQVLAWCAEIMGFPAAASGLLVSGGTMANLLGLAVARHAAALSAGCDVRRDGVQALSRRLRIYGSTEIHGWAARAVEVLGLGSSALRLVETDSQGRIDVAALAAAVAADRAAGHLPCCIAGTAGTVNTGAIDDLDALAELCRVERLWFHVDGAFGALARLSPHLGHLVRGIERADSLGFDLHKWGSLPFECACVLIRDAELHRAAFAMTARYLAPSTRGVIAGGLPFADRGIELTRGFRALKVWLSWKAHGMARLARIIEQNVEQAAYLAAGIAAHPDLELLAPVPLNVVCFRYRPATVAPDDAHNALNTLNAELLLRLQETGVAAPSGTEIDGCYALRVANVNHRSRRSDFDALLAAVLEIGAQLARQAALR